MLGSKQRNRSGEQKAGMNERPPSRKRPSTATVDLLSKLQRIALQEENLRTELAARFVSLAGKRANLLAELAAIEREMSGRIDLLGGSPPASIPPADEQKQEAASKQARKKRERVKGDGKAAGTTSVDYAADALVPAGFPDLPERPAVPVSESIQGDVLVCLIDGEKRKMLHRHLMSKYGITPERYREHFGLPDDYPMTAPGYSKSQSRAVSIAITSGRVPHRSRLRETNSLRQEPDSLLRARAEGDV